MAEPGDGRAVAIEVRFAQDRIVGTAVEVNEDPFGRHGQIAGGRHELAIEVFRFRLVEAFESTRQPATPWMASDLTIQLSRPIVAPLNRLVELGCNDPAEAPDAPSLADVKPSPLTSIRDHQQQ